MKALNALFLLVLIFQISCQVAPTKVVETRQHEVQLLMDKAGKKLQITEATQVIDVRSSFEYTMLHLPGSVHMNWEHFSQKRGPAPGLLPQDLEDVAKRLALKGLHPDLPIIVVGEGLSGEGEEGRMAWMLFYLGFDDVQTADIKLFNKQLTNYQTQQKANADRWTPQLRDSIQANHDEVLKALKDRSGEQKLHIIDARSKEEYFSKKGLGEGYSTPDLQAINIEWKEFFNKSGRPEMSIVNKLKAVGVEPSDRIIVISNKGVRSAAATWALLALGFHRSANFTGGYSQLISR